MKTRLIWKDTGNNLNVKKLNLKVDINGFNTRARTISISIGELGIKDLNILIENTPFEILESE